MKIREIISESPIGSWDIDPDIEKNEKEMVSKFTGYDKESKHWPDVDKRTINDPQQIEKIKNVFSKVPQSINVYFWQSTNPNYDIILQKGLVDFDWIEKTLGQKASNHIKKTD